MKVIIQGAASDSYSEANNTLDGFRVAVTSTTISEVTDAILQSINITATLYRKDDTTQIIAGNLLALGISNNPSSYEGLAIGSYKSFKVDLGHFINLKETDTLNVVVTVGSAVAGQVVTVSTNYAVGVELFTPVVRVFPIDKTRGNYDVQLGDSVTKVAVVNVGDVNVITDMNFRSNLINQQYSVADFYSLMSEQWEREPEYYAFLVYADTACQKASASLQVNTGLTENCYIVSYGGKTSSHVTQRAQKLLRKIGTETMQKYGV